MNTPATPSRVCVVIVNYRTPSLTIDCLRSLEPERAALGDRLSVIVTDNASPDDSINLLRTAITDNHWSDWITLLPLPHNGGFAYGNNAAIRQLLSSPTPPDYIHLLNPDTLLHPGAISELLTFMDSHPHAGIVGSRLENPDGSPQPSACRFHSLLGELDNGLRIGFISRLLSQHEIAPPAPTSTCRSDWISGASFFVRTELFRQIGLLDDRYFMYYEETDFCLRAARANWECWYCPASRVIHLQGQSTAGVKRLPKYYFDSRRWYFLKNHGPLSAAAADLIHALTFATWRLRRPLQRKPDNDPPHYLADFIRNSVFARGFKCL